jgi:hypothetical protein
MTEDQKAALKRLRRKVEIMHLDLKRANNTRYHDTAEMLALIALLEK